MGQGCRRGGGDFLWAGRTAAWICWCWVGGIFEGPATVNLKILVHSTVPAEDGRCGFFSLNEAEMVRMSTHVLYACMASRYTGRVYPPAGERGCMYDIDLISLTTPVIETRKEDGISPWI
jgi:hypothetical protein